MRFFLGCRWLWNTMKKVIIQTTSLKLLTKSVSLSKQMHIVNYFLSWTWSMSWILSITSALKFCLDVLSFIFSCVVCRKCTPRAIYAREPKQHGSSVCSSFYNKPLSKDFSVASQWWLGFHDHFLFVLMPMMFALAGRDHLRLHVRVMCSGQSWRWADSHQVELNLYFFDGTECHLSPLKDQGAQCMAFEHNLCITDFI